MTGSRHAGGRGAFLGLAALILGGLVFAAGVMVGRRMGPEEPDQSGGVLQRIDRRDQGAASRDGGALSFHRELNKPVAEPPPPLRPTVSHQHEAAAHEPDEHDPRPPHPEASGDAAPTDVADGTYSMQVASYREREQAEKLVEKLSESGYRDVRLVEGEVAGRGTYYRVRVGRFASREAAERQGEDLLSQEGLEGLIVREE